jgi:hypothetical protein
LLALQIAINTTLAHSYVHAVFAELHGGQDLAEGALVAQLSAIAALDYLSLEAFTATLELDFLPDSRLDPEAITLSDEVDAMRGFAQDISGLYRASYAEASDEFVRMRTGQHALIDTLTEDRDVWMGEHYVWRSDVIEYVTQIEQFAAALDGHHTDVAQWYGALTLWGASLGNERDLLQAQRVEGQAWSSAGEDWVTLWDDWLTHFDNVAFAEVEDVLADWAGWRGELAQTQANAEGVRTIIQNLQAWATAQAAEFGVPVPNPGAPWATLNGLFTPLRNTSTIPRPPAPDVNLFLPMPTFANPTPGSPATLWPTAPPGLPPSPVTPTPDPVDPFGIPFPAPADLQVPDLRDGFWDSFDAMGAQLDSFEVHDFLTDAITNEINANITRYGIHLDVMHLGVYATFEANVAQLAQIRFDYIDFLTGLRSDALDAEAYQMGNLHNRLGIFHGHADGFHFETSTQFSRLTELMPDSRTQAGVNTNLIDFTINPVQLRSPTPRAATTRDQHEHGPWLTITITALAAALLTGLTVQAVERNRLKGKG